MAAYGAETPDAVTGVPGPAPRQDAFTILGPGGGGTKSVHLAFKRGDFGVAETEMVRDFVHQHVAD